MKSARGPVTALIIDLMSEIVATHRVPDRSSDQV